MGLIVDGVSEVLMVPEEAVETTPSVAASAGSSHVRGIAKLGEDLVILLDVDALCGEQEPSEPACAAG